MSEMKQFGKIKGSYFQGTRVSWEIADLLSSGGVKDFKHYDSPIFFYEESAWMLSLTNGSGSLLLRITNVEGDEKHPFKYRLGLKKADGNLKRLFMYTDLYTATESGKQFFFRFAKIDKDELLHSKCELVPLNILTVVCSLEHEIDQFGPTSVSCEPAPSSSSLIQFEKVSEDFKNLYTNKVCCDVVLQVKEKEFQAHKAVLMARSSVFASTFRHDTLEKQTGVIIIPDCDPDFFSEFLEYLYCGKLEGITMHSSFHLYKISDKYDVQDLKSYCNEFMMKHVTADNVCDVVILANLYDEEKLMDAAQNVFNRNIKKVVTSAEWENLLKADYQLANKLIIRMASSVKIGN